MTNEFADKPKCNKHDSCEVCEFLPDNVKCNDRFLVYKFTCKHCNEFYIGQTSRIFKHRFYEHKRAVERCSDTSAVADHCLKCKSKKIDDFCLDIIGKGKDALDTRLTEARLIKQLIPNINRKKELTVF